MSINLKKIGLSASLFFPLSSLTILPAICFFARGAAAAGQAEAGDDDDAVMEAKAKKIYATLLLAIQHANYNEFVADADSNFKVMLPANAFLNMCQAISPRLLNGYQNTYLSSFNKQGSKLYIWKMTFTDGGDDFVVSLSIRNGKVIGFNIN